jgi:hypothetical protein
MRTSSGLLRGAEPHPQHPPLTVAERAADAARVCRVNAARLYGNEALAGIEAYTRCAPCSLHVLSASARTIAGFPGSAHIKHFVLRVSGGRTCEIKVGDADLYI